MTDTKPTQMQHTSEVPVMCTGELADLIQLVEAVEDGVDVDAWALMGASYGIAKAATALAEAAGESEMRVHAVLEQIVCQLDLAVHKIARALAKQGARCRQEPNIFRRPSTFALELLPGNHPVELMREQRYATAAEAQRFADRAADLLITASTEVRTTHNMMMQAFPWYFLDPDTPLRQPTALYRWYDDNGQLLYVGITGSLAGRQDAHGRKSSWAEFAARSTVERYPERAAAEQAEVTAIKAERPLFNHVHNDTPDARRRLVDYLVAANRVDLLAPAVSRG